MQIVAAVWCVGSAAVWALGSLSMMIHHGLTGLVIPGSLEAVLEAQGFTPSMKLPDLAVSTLFVVGQWSGATILLGRGGQERPLHADEQARESIDSRFV